MGDATRDTARRRQARRTILGANGEQAVADRLITDGHRIIGRNVRVGRDEIDILSEAGDVLHVIEVKTRGGIDFGGAEAVTPAKLARLRRAAARWLREADDATPGRPRRYAAVQFDVWLATPTMRGFHLQPYPAVI